MATTTEPSLIRGAVSLPAGRIGARGIAIGGTVAVDAALAIGLVTNAVLGGAFQAGALAAMCVALGVMFGVGLIAAAGRVDQFGAAMITLLSTIVLMFTAIAVGFAIQVAIEPMAGPFWLAIAAGCGAAMWTVIMTTLPMLGDSDEGL